jgi:hypothetical protein
VVIFVNFKLLETKQTKKGEEALAERAGLANDDILEFTTRN